MKVKYRPIFGIIVSAEDEQHAFNRIKDSIFRLHRNELTKGLELLIENESPEVIDAELYGLTVLEDGWQWYRMFMLLEIETDGYAMAKQQVAGILAEEHILPLCAHIDFCEGTLNDEIEIVEP